jgi:hypothetical protein
LVVHPGRHGNGCPGSVRVAAIEKPCRERFVSVGEDIGSHFHLLADHALGRELPAVDFGLHILDHDPFSAVLDHREIFSPFGLFIKIKRYAAEGVQKFQVLDFIISE